MKRFLSVLTVGLVPFLSFAQTPPTTVGGLTVRSTPSGAIARLEGDVTVTGVTPTTLQHRLAGEYTLTVSKHLYETYKSKLELDPSQPQALEVILARKNRWKGAVRSLFIPGWGQYYSEQKTKAFAFAGLTVASGIAFLVAEDEFQLRYDRFQESIRRYESLPAGTDPVRREEVFRQLEKDQADASDAEDIRRATIGVAIGVWTLNLLDILFFFPQEQGTINVQGVNVAPTASGDTFGVMLSRNF